MFNYISSETIIPSLTFTKAELIYVVSVLLKDLPNTDNSSRIEMVEIRHYLNLAKESVAQALADGTIGRDLVNTKEVSTPESSSAQTSTENCPSISELKVQFPNLSEEEIQMVLQENRAEQERESQKKASILSTPSASSFIAEEDDDFNPDGSSVPNSPNTEKNRENSKKFAQMLGAI